MDSTAQLIVIEDLLAWPLPDEVPAQESGRGGQCYHLVDLAAGDRLSALHAVVAALSARFGPARTVALDGFTDPSLRCVPGPPLADVLADRAIEMYGWTVGQRWLGVGLLKDAEDGAPCLAAAVSGLAVPAKPAESSWTEELVALTGWRGDQRPVDWGTAERGLGLRLPRDYKLLAEAFGPGTFDDSLDLRAPGSRHLTLGLICADRAEFADPAPSKGPTIRLLQWATTSAGHSFCWPVEHPDPQEWPVLARSGVIVNMCG